jgi:hypothetical protein
MEGGKTKSPLKTETKPKGENVMKSIEMNPKTGMWEVWYSSTGLFEDWEKLGTFDTYRAAADFSKLIWG